VVLDDPSVLAALALLPVWVAAAIDVRTRRIPNWLTGGALAVVIVVGAASGALLATLGGAALGLLSGVVVAVLAGRTTGGFGGGDVKLMAYGGGALGIGAVPAFLFWMSLAGGVIALAVIFARRRAARGLTMPYGPAIAAGMTVTLLVA
jgi:Flp pilus assembly protein protease CpaA